MEMVAVDNSPPRDNNSIGTPGTAINTVTNRLTTGSVEIPLAKFSNLARWVPKIGDFVIWHGWVRHWYGVIGGIEHGYAIIITEGLPCLLFTLGQHEYPKRSVRVPIAKIKNCRGGEYHILQGDTWFIE